MLRGGGGGLCSTSARSWRSAASTAADTWVRVRVRVRARARARVRVRVRARARVQLTLSTVRLW